MSNPSPATLVRTKNNLVSAEHIQECTRQVAKFDDVVRAAKNLEDCITQLRAEKEENQEEVINKVNKAVMKVEELKLKLKNDNPPDIDKEKKLKFLTEITRVTGLFETLVIAHRDVIESGVQISTKILKRSVTAQAGGGGNAYVLELFGRRVDDVLGSENNETYRQKIADLIEGAKGPIDGYAAELYDKYSVDLSPIYGLIAVYVCISAVLSLMSFVSGGLPKDLISFFGSLTIACVAIYFLYRNRQRKLKRLELLAALGASTSSTSSSSSFSTQGP